MKRLNLISGMLIAGWVCLIFILSPLSINGEKVYAKIPLLNVRERPSLHSKRIAELRHGRWVDVSKRESKWVRIKLNDGRSGYVSAAMVTDIWILVLKKERKLILKQGVKQLKKVPIGLGFNPNDDKIKLGDGCTPEGRFYICESNLKPTPFRTYGVASLRISYPNIEDARRGLQSKLITKTQYHRIVKAIHRGIMPPQNTKLGGSIKIHGGDPGASSDWTLGCVALKNGDLSDIVSRLPKGPIMVEVFSSYKSYFLSHDSNRVNRSTLKQAFQLLKRGCLYTRAATRIIPLKYPMGDFDPKSGVCTDVVIRSLRGIQIDLQALLYEDILIHPSRYPKIPKANPNIDHRRTRNLKIFFDHHARVLTCKTPKSAPGSWRAGDIVLMDTGIRNGTIYDHIGIVSPNKGADSVPLVINLWTVGSELNEMELLKGDYPKIVGHYRLHSPLYYAAYSRE